jgi:hypothetical protein
MLSTRVHVATRCGRGTSERGMSRARGRRAEGSVGTKEGFRFGICRAAGAMRQLHFQDAGVGFGNASGRTRRSRNVCPESSAARVSIFWWCASTIWYVNRRFGLGGSFRSPLHVLASLGGCAGSHATGSVAESAQPRAAEPRNPRIAQTHARDAVWSRAQCGSTSVGAGRGRRRRRKNLSP